MAMFLWFGNKKKSKEEKNKVLVEPKVEKEEKTDKKVLSKGPVLVSQVNTPKKPAPKKAVKGKYEVFPVGEKFVYRLKANNGEILVTSDLYTTQKGALNAIEIVKKNAAEGGIVDHYQDKHGLWQFKLLAVNKRILVVSANYSSLEGCQSAEESFKKFANISDVVILEEDTEKSMKVFTLDAKLEDKNGGKIALRKVNKDYFFQILASNGAILCTSIDYKSKASLDSGLQTFKDTIQEDLFVCIKDKNNFYQFKMYNNTGICIAVGESYEDASRAKSAANSMASFINKAEVLDSTK